MTDVSAEEQRIIESLRNPVLWGQSYLMNRDGTPRRYWPHQVEDLLCEDRNIIHLDGRDAGKCQVGSTLIVDCDTGELVRLDELQPGRRICVLGPDLKVTTTREYQVLANGRKPCFRLRTAMGRTIEATGNHPLLSDTGWTRLDHLKIGDFLAVPRALPIHLPENPSITDEEICLLAYLIADGGLSTTSIYFTKADPIIVDEFARCVHHRFPTTKVARTGQIGYRVAIDRQKMRAVKNPCKSWLRGLGLMGCRSEGKFVPAVIAQCSDRQIALFLSRLYGCDGWFATSRTPGGSVRAELGYCSASKEIVALLGHLLLRLGIMSRTRTKIVNGKCYWTLDVNTLEDVRRFDRLVGFYGVKDSAIQDYLADAAEHPVNAHDRIPVGLVRQEVERMKAAGVSTVTITGNPNRRLRLDRYHPSRWLIEQYAENTGSSRLHELAASDIYWDRVASIEPIGVQDTYDLSVPGYRNYVANDVIVHNSISLTTDALHYAFTTRGGQGLIAAPHQGHLDTLVEEIEFQLDSNPELMNSIGITKYGKPKIYRKPYFRLEFTNGSILYFRPAGAYGDAFRSLHVERVWVDEGAWLSEKAWKALRQCLKAGGRLRIYSTPNGLRDTTYFRLTNSSSFKVFRWPSWVNPNWDDEREQELLEFYGGRDTAGWQHEVAGEHGKPSYGAFSLENLSACRQEVMEYRKVTILGEDLSSCETEEESYDRLEMLLNLMPQTGVFWIGGDLGYTNDPTELLVFREMEYGERSVMTLILRLHMEHVSYPHIAQTIGLLERYFTPVGIGVDNGGNGLAVVQELLTLDRYKPLQLEGRLRGYDFGGMTTLAIRDGREIRKRTKELMTSLINGAMQRRQIVLPAEDGEIEDQFTTHTYTLSNGNIIYSKGNDHIIDAVRCAMLVHEQGSLDQITEETVCVVPVVTNPIFI